VLGSSLFNTPELSYKTNKQKRVQFSLEKFSFTIVIDSVETKASSQLDVAKSIRMTTGII
jgi:hypothetical protein